MKISLQLSKRIVYIVVWKLLSLYLNIFKLPAQVSNKMLLRVLNVKSQQA